jgi:hypothetical protein
MAWRSTRDSGRPDYLRLHEGSRQDFEEDADPGFDPFMSEVRDELHNISESSKVLGEIQIGTDLLGRPLAPDCEYDLNRTNIPGASRNIDLMAAELEQLELKEQEMTLKVRFKLKRDNLSSLQFQLEDIADTQIPQTKISQNTRAYHYPTTPFSSGAVIKNAAQASSAPLASRPRDVKFPSQSAQLLRPGIGALHGSPNEHLRPNSIPLPNQVSEEWGHRQNLNDLRRLPSLGNQVDSCMANLALMDLNENAYDLTGGIQPRN